MVAEPDDGYWAAELGWETRVESEDFALFLSARHGGPRPVAGRLRTSRSSGWVPYFAVDSVEQTCVRVSELDGRVLVEPLVVPTGLVASVVGPHGGECVVLERPAGWGGTWSAG
ncbi:hypothetical protein [Lentzea guizhouensis]|nr:hypothetical protein [Lentzea guizhouensis]